MANDNNFQQKPRAQLFVTEIVSQNKNFSQIFNNSQRKSEMIIRPKNKWKGM